jgi:exodeoxyribonuclease V beta subunit
LARLSKDCQQLLKNYQKEEDRLSPDDLLRKMQWALHQGGFKGKIQSQYQAAIIDEFQDTDPIQWEIFQQLFIPNNQSWNGNLYLVGDPKQSIYSFRQADIYTYLKAAQLLGEENCFSLETNYRSQPSLVEALNVLFDSKHVSGLIPLPKQQFHLPYQPVQFSPLSKEMKFSDQKGVIHFFIGDGKGLKKAKLSDLETQVFFPFILKEIQALKKEGVSFHQFAILVRDRHQALRLAEFFDRHQISYLNQRGMSLAESSALSGLIDVLKAILHPHDLGAVKGALGSCLLGWTYEEMKKSSELSFVLMQIQLLRHSLFQQGFSHFFQEFLKSKWKSDENSVLEHLLTQERGIEIYHDLKQIAEIIIEHQYRDWMTPEGLIPFLDLFHIWHENEDERIKRFQDPHKDGVKILSLHFSKGLEFDIVFSLGLVNRVGIKEELFPVERDGKIVLAPLSEESQDYELYCEENDAEKMRQLYVALTRAKYRLYIPVALHLSSDALKIGEASPIDLFLARLKQPLCSYKELYQRIKNEEGKHLLEFLDETGKGYGMSYSLDEQIVIEKNIEVFTPKIMSPPSEIKIPYYSLLSASFSSLASPLSPDQAESLFDLPHDFEAEHKTIFTLPSDQETGILLHHILKKIHFQDFRAIQSASQAIGLIKPFLQKTCFKNWLEVIAELIFTAVKHPLLVDEPSFCLADLWPHQLYREMPFLFPYDKKMPIEGVTFSEGFLKGIIDLIFSYKGKYYLLDWKSHWLGPALDGYDKKNLYKVMIQNQYFLQANLYVEALKRYLHLVDSRPFEECFGGVLYVFMRGLDQEKQTGIYHFYPQEMATTKLVENLASY